MTIEALYRAHQKEIQYAMLSFCRKAELAADASQQAFLKAWQNQILLESMPGPAAKAWLFATARNYIVDDIRKTGRILYTPEDTLWDAATEDTTKKVLLAQLVKELPSPQREIVSLRHYANMNSTEIGAQLNIPPPTVRYHLSQAMVALRNKV